MMGVTAGPKDMTRSSTLTMKGPSMHAKRLHTLATVGLYLLGMLTLVLSCALAWLVLGTMDVSH